MIIQLLGSGTLTTAGISSKAARLDDAIVGGLAVPTASVVPDGADASEASLELSARHTRNVAVRSAFGAEDRDDQSLAGHFDSILNVKPAVESLRAAIDRVRASGGSQYRRDVLVMDMVNPNQAGVAFSEPGWLDDLVNYTDGLGDDLLSGEEAGKRLELDRRRRAEDTDAWQGRLAGLLDQCRNCFGDSGWDIEFADDGTTCWLLQIRPITSSPLRNEWFTLANHREILPDPPSVFMTSLIAEASPQLSGPLGILDGAAEGRRFIEVFDRRPYLNLSLLTDFLRKIGLPTSLVADSLGGSDGRSVPADPMHLVRQTPTLGRMGLRQLAAARTARRVAETMAAVEPSPGDRFGPVVEAACASYVALVDQMASLATAMAVPISIVGKVGSLDYHLRKQRTAATQMLDDIHSLANLVRSKPDVLAQLELGQIPDDAGFKTGWNQWLSKHGQRGQFESDLSKPRYSEDPTPILKTVGRIAATSRTAPPASSSWKALLTTPLWIFARGPMSARESLRADAMHAFAQHRSDLVRCALAAQERGALPAAEDIWMLTTDELRSLDEGHQITEAHLAERTADFERCAAIDAPDIRQRFHTSDLAELNDSNLTGLPLTSGLVEGVAWVLREPTAERPTELGEAAADQVILIARSVDAGWVPLFGQVGGVAVDIGGDLSHGSIILRELGLPAITNTRRGTSAFATGDRVRLDARSGTLTRI